MPKAFVMVAALVVTAALVVPTVSHAAQAVSPTAAVAVSAA